MSDKPHQWDRKGDVMFTRTLSGEIADEDWYKFLEDLKNGVRVVFAVSHGDVAPSATQRRDAAKILSDHKITAIVLTDSRVSRGILTAMSWFGASVMAFPWTELQRAVEAASESEEVRQQLISSATNFRKSVK
jgi:predicted Fe-Mo cluster-binding NifX family protein